MLLLIAWPVLAQPVAPAAPPPAAAPPATAAPGPAEIERALEILRDEARRAELIRLLEVLAAAQRAGSGSPEAPAPAPATPVEALSTATEQMGRAMERAVAALHLVADLPGLWAWLVSVATDPWLRDRVFELAWKLLVVFGSGMLVERGLQRALRRWSDRLDAAIPAAGAQDGWLARAPLILLRVIPDLIPVAGFAGAAWLMVQSLPGWPSQRVILWTVATAYVAARGIMVLARLAFSPASAHLRLLPVGDETAAYATVWIRRLALVAVSAYAASEFALLLAMPRSVQLGMLRGGLLVVSVFVCIIVLQNKLAVAQWLAAPPLAEGDEPDRLRRFFRGLRNRFADAWHVLAILWVVAMWAVWALELERGFERLLRASMLTVLVVVAAKLLDEAMRRSLSRGFRIGAELAQRFPGLEARANRYLPALKGLLSALIALFSALVILEVWGIGAFGWFRPHQPGARLLASLVHIGVTLAIALLVWEAANSAIQRHLARLAEDAATARSARVRTLLPLLRTAIAVTVMVVAGLNVLTQLGVNVAPLLAGAGVVGLAIGFGSQTLVRDVITGIFLLFEDAIAVGDVVTVGGLTGTVEDLSIRSIRLRAVDGSVHIVPFSAVTTVTNMTRDYAYALLDLSLPHEADTDRVAQLLKEVGDELRLDETFGEQVLAPIEVMGVERLTDLGIVMRARIKTVPARRWAVARELNRRVKLRCDELGIPLDIRSRMLERITTPQPG
ncbi:MAG: mechanosensitive ion channel [Rhodovarius sp.]|nr:mechanosensitive ion channel [Rhodovarius sp.]